MHRVIEHLCHSFVPDFIGPGGVALDCGSNAGGFAEWLSKNTGAIVFGFEPDPRLFASLPVLERVTFFPQAVAAQKGKLVLSLGEGRCSSVHYLEHEKQDRIEVSAIQLEEFCNERAINIVEFIKMDIEGAEIPVLLGASDTFLTSVKQITVEFHDFLRHEDIPEIRRIVARLEKLGFSVIKFSHFTFGDLLFLNRRFIDFGVVDLMHALIFAKYGPGISRLVKRKLFG